MGVQGWSSWDAEHCGWKLRLCPHLLGQLGTDSLQCPAQVQEFTHFSLGSRIHSSAVLQACANGPLVPNTEPGSWVDSESNETLLALSNYLWQHNAKQATELCCGNTRSTSRPWPPGHSARISAPSLHSGLGSNSSALEAFPGRTPIPPCPLTQPYVSSRRLPPPDLTCINCLAQNVNFMEAETLSCSLRSSQLLYRAWHRRCEVNICREKERKEGGKLL